MLGIADIFKMLTQTDKDNIKDFDKLNKNHQRVFRHRLCKKFIKFQEDLEIVLLNYERLDLKIDKIVNITQLIKLLELYENISKLQNRYIF